MRSRLLLLILSLGLFACSDEMVSVTPEPDAGADAEILADADSIADTSATVPDSRELADTGDAGKLDIAPPEDVAKDVADTAPDTGPVGGPFEPIPAVISCAPAGDACGLGEAVDAVHASYRKDYFIPFEVHPEQILEDPVDGGRIHVTGLAAVSGHVTGLLIDGVDAEELLPVEPLLDWYHVWPRDVRAGEPMWVAFHSRDPKWDGVTSARVTVQTDAGVALDTEFPVQPTLVPLTYVTPSDDLQTLLVHVHNDDDVPHTLTGLFVNGRDVLAAGVACVSDREVAPGQSALWTVPRCEPWTLGEAWTVVAEYADAAPAAAGGRILKPHFPIESWPSSSECPLPGLEGDNFEFQMNGGIDTLYIYWNGYQRCGYDRMETFTETLPAVGDAYLLLGDDFPWENPPAERMEDTSAILGFLTGDESDWHYFDDGFPNPARKARKATALWQLYPELLTYNGAMTNKHIGAFAGMTDVQGVDIYNGACAPHIFQGPERPGPRAPYDYLLNARNNHMPWPTWLYSQGLAGWPVSVSWQEIENQALSVAAAGGKGLMWFQIKRDVAEEQPETWEAIQEMNWLFRSVRRYLREGDITGMVRTDAGAVVELVRAREALVLLAIAVESDNQVNDLDCVVYQATQGEEPHWQFSEQSADITLTIPADFAAEDIFEIVDGAVVELEYPVLLDLERRELTLLGVPFGMEAPTRVFVLGADDGVRAHVLEELARR